jgi:hypothetical protein
MNIFSDFSIRVENKLKELEPNLNINPEEVGNLLKNLELQVKALKKMQLKGKTNKTTKPPKEVAAKKAKPIKKVVAKKTVVKKKKEAVAAKTVKAKVETSSKKTLSSKTTKTKSLKNK